MPPFVYPQFQDRYAGSIADIMLRRGDIAAQGAQREGDIRARALESSGQALSGAIAGAGATVGGAIAQQADPQRKLAQQQVDANDRSLKYQTTAANIARSLVGPNGEEPDPDTVTKALTAAGIPVAMHKSILEPFESMQRNHKEAMADAGAVAYRVLKTLPPDAPEEDRNHAAAAALGAAVAAKLVAPPDAKRMTDALGAGADPLAMALGFMGSSPGGRYKDLIQDESKPITVPATPRGGAPAQVVTPGGRKIAEGAPAPEQPPTAATIALKAAGGDAAGAMNLLHPKPAAAQLERASVMLDGKPADVLIDRTPGAAQKVFDLAGKPIANPDVRVVPIPPAAIQVNAAAERDAAKAPEVDALRPVGEGANKIDARTGMTPNRVYQSALAWALEGKSDSLGMGGGGRARAARDAVQNKGAAIAAAAGVDVPTVRAEYAANKSTLAKLLPQATAAANLANTARDNLNLALEQSDEVTRTGAKLANRYLQWFQGELTPAKGLTKFETYIYTAAREYAKVTSGSAASSQGLTDSAQREASHLLNAAQSPEAFAAAVDAMNADMANVIRNQREMIAGVSKTIANFFSAANGLPPGDGAPAKAPAAAAAAAPAAAPKEGTQQPIPGVPGGVAEFRGGKWIRIK